MGGKCFIKSVSLAHHFFPIGWISIVRSVETNLGGRTLLVDVVDVDFSYIYFWLDLLYSVPYLFFYYWSPSLSLYRVSDSISFNIDELPSMYPCPNAFVFGGFNVHHKHWPTCSGGTDRLVNSVIISLSQIIYNFSS